MIGFSDELDTFRGYLAENSDSNARSWEGMAHDEVFVNTKLTTKSAYFVFEELKNSDQPNSKSMHLSSSSVPLVEAQST